MEIWIGYIIKSILLPPGCLLLLIGIAVLPCCYGKKSGRVLICIALSGFYLLSLPFIVNSLASQLEPYPAMQLDAIKAGKAQAIVVLGGGMKEAAKEFSGAASVNSRTLARIRYASIIARKSSLPLLVSGGKVFDTSLPSEAELMANVLQDEFQIAVRWQESSSRNTAQNAQYSYQMLKQEGIENILLVTDAKHMQRAIQQFKLAGFKVQAAPMNFYSSKYPVTVLSFLPSAVALSKNSALLHEVLGKYWYQLRYN